MSRYLRGNEERKENARIIQTESVFAQQVMAHVGGSCVYIEPKKAKKFIDTEQME